MSSRDVVFTALFGGYESLNELQIEKDLNTLYVCFTDDPLLNSETWEVRLVKPSVPNNPSRSSRNIKILGHKYFPQGVRSLYIDNTVKLKVDGAKILDAWLGDGNLAFMSHYSRKTVRGEFLVCSAYGLDKQSLIRKQFQLYKNAYPEILSQRPFWGGMIARINTPQTDIFMEEWKEQFDLFTRRDQLSINVSSAISGIQIKSIAGSNADSQWHEWPMYSNRIKEMRDSTSVKSFRKIRIILNLLRYGYYFYLPLRFNSKSLGD